MTIPLFNAEASLYTTSERYRMAPANRSGMGIVPALMTAQWCYREGFTLHAVLRQVDRILTGDTSASSRLPQYLGNRLDLRDLD